MLKRKNSSAVPMWQMLPALVGLGGNPWVTAFRHFATHLRHGKLTVELPDGQVLGFTGTANGQIASFEELDELHAVLRIRDANAIRSLFTRGDIGFAEAYMDGQWDSPDLTRLIRLAAANQQDLAPREMGFSVIRMANRIGHLARRNSKRNSKRNIAYHYDLGNDFYEAWLDPSMTYSSALFEGETANAGLEAAQEAKYRLVAEQAGLKPGMTVLEIGCGWGGFAEIAARDYGCNVVGVTLSKEQLAFAKARMERLGLADKVDLRLCDYRDMTGSFDAIASIEMFEAVGEEHWPIYFRKVQELLKPGGAAALQVISIDAKRFDHYRSRCDFIQKYIFPGGMLPSVPVFCDRAGEAGLEVTDSHMFTASYAETLKRWQRSFQHAWPEIEQSTGFDLRFKRMWEYYLSYCEAGFAEKTIDVGVHRLVRTA
ncbi:MAG: class I SAM-dependent methyltransferase [Rhodospirillaceae bacterium]